MKVILTDTKQVKDVPLGYAVNYLLPKKLAVIASKAKLEALKNQVEEKTAAKSQRALEDRQQAEKLNGKVLSFKGGVSKKELAAKLKILAENVVLERSLKKAGEYPVILKFGKEKAEIKIKVLAK